mgnify:CR=1 FL=1
MDQILRESVEDVRQLRTYGMSLFMLSTSWGQFGEELARIFCVARHLKRLSLQTGTLPALGCEADCWWSEGRPQEEWQALTHQVGQGPCHTIETFEDHFSIVSSGSQYESLQGEVEETLAEIWPDVLDVELVGRHDNFFELGGHSLLALKVLEQMRHRGLTVQVRTLFQHPEMEAFAQAISQKPRKNRAATVE